MERMGERCRDKVGEREWVRKEVREREKVMWKGGGVR